jgi:S1-C subfamily serine protease
MIRRGLSYGLRAEGESPIWVNGQRIEETILDSGDVIEVGRDGPILRFRLYPTGSRAYKSPQEAFSDCIDCAKHSSSSSVGQAATMVAMTPKEMATQTSVWFRVSTILALAFVVGLIIAQWRSVLQLQRQIEKREVEIEGLSDLLEESLGYLSQEDLERIRTEIGSAVERVEMLEARSSAPARVVSAASRSVVFIQGAFGFVDPKSGDDLRFAVASPGGEIMVGPDGSPAVTVGGPGPPVEVVFTGTGFVATSDGLLVTNRHVALPWDFDASAQQVMAVGLSPVMRRFEGYLPGIADPMSMTLLSVSATADLAVLRPHRLITEVSALELSLAQQEIGAEVLVLGYPTGINALLARTDEATIDEIANERARLDVWGVTEKLAQAGHIRPLASRGIIAQVTASAVVFDAETTQGGSGGPILDLEGKVVAVTSAIIREFGGSNLGVPAAQARELLIDAKLQTLIPPRVR